MEAEPVKKQMQVLTEMTFIYVLKLLGVEDEKTLAELVSRLREGTPFYDFTFLAHNLAKSRTDFDFLTSPENLAVYAKIAEISRDCDVQLLPYVNVLGKIAERKQWGLYSENLEVGFFLDEYWRYRETVPATDFLHQFKKILKYETQLLFEHFIRDGIFSLIQQTLQTHSFRIKTERMLSIFVYCLHYYQSDISNDDENFLIEHIAFCVDYLSKHGEIDFKPLPEHRLLPRFADEAQALAYFFSHDDEASQSLDRFIGFLKDVCPTADALDFCAFLRKARSGAVYPHAKSKFIQMMTVRITSKARTVLLYKDILALLPLQIVCERTPNMMQIDGLPCYIFVDSQHVFLFHARKTGNGRNEIPEAHVPVVVEVCGRDKRGTVLQWTWREIQNDC